MNAVCVTACTTRFVQGKEGPTVRYQRNNCVRIFITYQGLHLSTNLDSEIKVLKNDEIVSSCETCPENKDTSLVGRQGNFYAYYGNTAVDLDPLPVSRARLTVVEPALFE